jgi:hypothetical protein
VAVLYKYLKREHAKSLLTDGILMLGTLRGYRDEERYGPDIGDDCEGVKFSHTVPDHIWTPQHSAFWLPRPLHVTPKLPVYPRLDNGKLVSLSAGLFDLSGDIEWSDSAVVHIAGSSLAGATVLRVHKKVPPGDIAWPWKSSPGDSPNRLIRISGVTFDARQECDDHFVYATSMIFDLEVLSEPGYDDCVVILDSVRFFAAISESIRSEAEFEGSYRCVYLPRTVPNSVHPALLKDPQYSSQQEVRALWRPKKPPIAPKIIECPDVTQYCRPFDLNVDKDIVAGLGRSVWPRSSSAP